tara:strand:- start:214 stop:657 length:444 start_codon:yes stop_codon:yes gene_type:complete
MFAAYYRDSTTFSLCVMSMITINVALSVSMLLIPGLTFSEALSGTDAQRLGSYASGFLFTIAIAFLIASGFRDFNIGAPKAIPLSSTRLLVLAVGLLASMVSAIPGYVPLEYWSIPVFASQGGVGLAIIYGALRSPRASKEGSVEAF